MLVRAFLGEGPGEDGDRGVHPRGGHLQRLEPLHPDRSGPRLAVLSGVLPLGDQPSRRNACVVLAWMETIRTFFDSFHFRTQYMNNLSLGFSRCNHSLFWFFWITILKHKFNKSIRFNDFCFILFSKPFVLLQFAQRLRRPHRVHNLTQNRGSQDH